MCKFSTISLVGQTIGPFYSMNVPKKADLLYLFSVYLHILQGKVLYIVLVYLGVTRGSDIDIFEGEVLEVILFDIAQHIKYHLAVELDVA